MKNFQFHSLFLESEKCMQCVILYIYIKLIELMFTATPLNMTGDGKQHCLSWPPRVLRVYCAMNIMYYIYLVMMYV